MQCAGFRPSGGGWCHALLAEMADGGFDESRLSCTQAKSKEDNVTRYSLLCDAGPSTSLACSGSLGSRLPAIEIK